MLVGAPRVDLSVAGTHALLSKHGLLNLSARLKLGRYKPPDYFIVGSDV